LSKENSAWDFVHQDSDSYRTEKWNAVPKKRLEPNTDKSSCWMTGVSFLSDPEVGKVSLKSNGDEALSDEFLLKSNSDEGLNDVFP
jgi:hypothetical protein